MTFDEIKDEIRQRCDIVDVINSYVPLKKAGANHVACCPFHNEKTPSFNVSGDRQFFHCFGCQKGGDVFTFVMEHEGVDFIGALRTLSRFAGIPFDEDQLRAGGNLNPAEAKKRREGKDLLLDLHERLTTWYQRNLYSDIGAHALEYVRQRGLSEEMIKHFQLGFAPDSWDACLNWGKHHDFPYQAMLDAGVVKPRNPDDADAGAYDLFRGRLMFPIWNPQGRVVGFSGRALGEDDGPKYLNTPATPLFDKSRILYGLPLARKAIRERGFTLLCEGQMDVIACHAAGFTNAVAPQGTAFTPEQARLLKRHAEQLVLCFDSDSAGIKAALRSIDVFVPEGLSARVVLLGDGEDPSSLVHDQGPEALQSRIDAARDFFEFLLDSLVQEHDLSDPQSQGTIATEFLTAVDKLANRITRAAYCKLLADRIGIPTEYVFQQLTSISNRRKRSQQFRQQRGAPSRDNGRQQNRGYDREPPPFDEEDPPDMEASPFNLPPEESLICKAEVDLLDIALHHEAYARRMVEQLPPEFVSKSAVGQALNLVIAHSAQGEWHEAEEILLESFRETTVPPAISSILIKPAYDTDADARKVLKGYSHCLRRLIEKHFDHEIEALRARQGSAGKLADALELQRTIDQLRKDRTSRLAYMEEQLTTH